ncbi:hypothetical protein HDV05_006491 [Chytridiales sp. JEL 0842]|nr:hypothetical protein HDV05_006491 [Chytridiales sp. JEL 0842]
MFTAKGQSITLKSWEKNFVLQISDLLLLDEIQSYEMLRSCIRYELQAPIVRTRYANFQLTYDNQLLDAVLTHYFEERQATLDVLGSLFRAAENASHPYHEEIRDFVADLIQAKRDHKSEFAMKILAQYKEAVTKRVPAHVETSSRRSVLWAKQYLLEQKGLLQLLFLMYYDIASVTPQEFLEIVEALNTSRFSMDQPNESLFEEDTHVLWKTISLLSGLVFITIMNLEKSLDADVDMQSDDDASSPKDEFDEFRKQYQKTNTLLLKYMENSASYANTIIGPVYLTWGSFLQRTSMSDAHSRIQWDGTEIGRLSAAFISIANEINVFDYLENILRVYINTFDDPNILGYKSVVKGLLVLFVTCFDVGNQSSFDSIVRCVSQLFADTAEVCEQFWIQDYPIAERRAILDSARARFPYESKPLLTFLCSLVADHQTAVYVFRYFKSLGSFTSLLREELVEKAASGALVLNQDISLVPDVSPRLQIVAPNQTPIKLLSMDMPIGVLNLAYSGFHLVLSWLGAFNESIGNLESDESGNTSKDLVTGALNLLNVILSFADKTLVDEIMDHLCEFPIPRHESELCVTDVITIFCRTLARCCTFQTPPVALLKACLRTLTLMLPHYPDIVWVHLRQESIIPNYSGIGTTDFQLSGSSRYMQQVLLPYERSCGTYETTLAFLDLLQSMCDHCVLGDFQSESLRRTQDEVVISCLNYVQTEIFPTYGSWRYVRLIEKYQIGLKVMGIYNSLLTQSSLLHVPTVGESDLMYHDYILKNYMSEGSLYQITPLLDIVTTGNELPERLYRSQCMKEGYALESCIVESLKFIRNLLLWRKLRNSPSAILEHALLDRTVRVYGKQEATELMHIIGLYIMYDYNIAVPRYATEVLTLLCLVAADWQPRPPSFVGYFGSNAPIIVSAFVELASDKNYQSDSSSVDTKAVLQCDIFNFVTAVVRTQPGLGTLFLSGIDQSNTNGVLDEGRTQMQNQIFPTSSILNAVLVVLEDFDGFLQHRPDTLSAAIRLLESIWKVAPEHKAILDKLRKHAKFWDTLSKIVTDQSLTSGISGNMVHTLRGFVLRILAHEVYFNTPKDNQQPSSSDQIIKSIFTKHLENYVTVTKLSNRPKQLEREFMRAYPYVNLNALRCLQSSGVFEAHELVGASFLYDISLLTAKLDGYNVSDDAKANILHLIKEMNEEVSVYNGQLNLLRALTFFIQMCLLRLDVKYWDHGGPSGSKVKLIGDIMEYLTKSLNDQSGTETSYLYQTELMPLVLVLSKKWLELIESSVVAADSGSRTVTLLRCLLNLSMSFSTQHRQQGDQFQVSLRSNLHCSVLLLLRSLRISISVKPSQELEKASSEACLFVLPTIAQSLNAALSNRLADDNDGDDHIATLLSTMTEAIQLLGKTVISSNVSLWLPILEKQNIMPLLLNVFSSAQQGNGYVYRSHSLYIEGALELLLHLSCLPAAASRLAQSGFMATFSNNPLASALVEGSLLPYTGAERNPDHRLWCLLLLIIAEVSCNVSEYRFAESVVSFMRLYWKQFENTLLLSQNDNLSLGKLEEVEAITQLLYGLAQSDAQQNNLWSELDAQLLSFCDELFLRLLDNCAFLLRHPSILSFRTVAISREERESAQHSSNATSSLVNEVQGRLVLIVRNVIAVLRFSSSVEQRLTSFKSTDWANDVLAVNFGTLFEIVSFLVDALKTPIEPQAEVPKVKKNDISDQTVHKRSCSLDNISFSITQLLAFIVSHGIGGPDERRRDVMDSIQQARSALDSACREKPTNGALKQALQEVKDLEYFFTK